MINWGMIEILSFLDKGYGRYIPLLVENYMRKYIPNFDAQMRRFKDGINH